MSSWLYYQGLAPREIQSARNAVHSAHAWPIILAKYMQYNLLLYLESTCGSVLAREVPVPIQGHAPVVAPSGSDRLNAFFARLGPFLHAVLRIGVGLLFMQHGVQKLFGWLGG